MIVPNLLICQGNLIKKGYSWYIGYWKYDAVSRKNVLWPLVGVCRWKTWKFWLWHCWNCINESNLVSSYHANYFIWHDFVWIQEYFEIRGVNVFARTFRWFLFDNNIDLWFTVVKSIGSLNLLIILYHPVDNFGLSWLEIEWIQNPDARSDHKGLLLFNSVSCFGWSESNLNQIIITFFHSFHSKFNFVDEKFM